jgi:phosphoglycolate phosphatase
MMTAKNAGVSVCGVTWGFRPRTELEAHHPDFLVDKAEEILGIVKAK